MKRAMLISLFCLFAFSNFANAQIPAGITGKDTLLYHSGFDTVDKIKNFKEWLRIGPVVTVNGPNNSRAQSSATALNSILTTLAQIADADTILQIPANADSASIAIMQKQHQEILELRKKTETGKNVNVKKAQRVFTTWAKQHEELFK